VHHDRTAVALRAFFRHDFRASITVFFVALPLCLGISLASGTSVVSGLVAGIVGGLIVSLLSRSELSVSGPAAGLTAICLGLVQELGSASLLFLSVAIAGILQVLLGLFRLGGFTHFIPSSVIKGMLAAIGLLLMSKQVPLLLGYDQPDFWAKEFFNIVTLDHAFTHIDNIIDHTSRVAVLVSAFTFAVLVLGKKYAAKWIPALPASFLAVLLGTLAAELLGRLGPGWALSPGQTVSIPPDVWRQLAFPDLMAITSHPAVWKGAVVICLVASLETLLSITAIDKLDPLNRVTPQDRELVAQGVGNTVSGLLGGLPVTAVIVRSAANAEAGARSRKSAFLHGAWLLVAVLLAIPLINRIPYSVLAVILVRTGYNLAKPSMLRIVFRQGREQFLPFIVTAGAILMTDLLIGVGIGVAFAIYFLIKHTYRSPGYTIRETRHGQIREFVMELAPNVSFLHKQKITQALDALPEYAVLEVRGDGSTYIDHDVLEIFHDFKAKAHRRHVELRLHGIREVETIELH